MRGPMWTAPACKCEVKAEEDQDRLRPYVRSERLRSLAKMVFAARVSRHGRGVGLCSSSVSSRYWIDRSHHLILVSQVPASPRLGWVIGWSGGLLRASSRMVASRMISPLIIIRQAMRAILLARATATSLGSFLASSFRSQGDCGPRPLRRVLQRAVAPTTSVLRKASSPARVMAALRRWRPAVEWSFGVNPIQAAKWRADFERARVRGS